MATRSTATDHVYGPADQGKSRSLRRSLTRLPVTTRIPRDHVVDEPTPPQSTLPSLRHVPKSDITSSRTNTNSRLQPKNVPVLPSVAQAQPPTDAPSIPGSSSKARPHERRSVHPPPSSTKTPSLVSGSTISSREGAHSALRRKPSTINQYVLRAKTDPESMQEHRDLIKTVHKVQYDDDPFPGAIFGMTLPPTSGLVPSKTTRRLSSSAGKPSSTKADTKPTHHTIESRGPFTDVASSRRSDSPFSHQSTPTSASSLSSVAASSLGSARHRDSLDPARSVEKVQARGENKSSGKSNATLTHKNVMKPRASDIKPQAEPEEERTRQKSSLHGPSSLKFALASDKASQVSTSKLTIRKPSQGNATVIPPEFAHLNVDPPQVHTTSKTIPPRRPSRDGIDGLGLSLDIPVVQSNLVPNDLSHITRVPSQGLPEPTSTLPPQSPRRTFGFSHRSSSRQSSTSHSEAVYPATPKTPIERSEIGSPLSRQDSPMVGPSPVALRSPRLGILPRRQKDSATPPATSEKPKKGPAAGTGHEGYGKFGFRGRGSSIFGKSRTSRSPSIESTTSRKGLSFLRRKGSTTSETDDDMDHFLEERREPIILRGNGSAAKMGTPENINDAQNVRADQPTTSSQEDYRAPLPTSDNSGPTAKVERPSLAKLVHEGKEGHWLSSPTSPKNPTFMQRFRSKITHQNSSTGLGHHRAANASHHGAVGQAQNVGLTDLEKLISGASQLSQGSKSSGGGAWNSSLLVPYDQRHEGLLPTPPTFHSGNKSFESPILLEAKTATSTKAPQPVELSKPAEPSHQEVSKTRLRSVGRIPQVVRAGQNSRAEPLFNTVAHQPLENTRQEKQQFASNAVGPQDFLAFPPRKNSELSYTSSSGLGSPCITRTSFVGEDEVWNEYDNLIDEVIPSKVRASTTSSLGAPFQYGDMVDHKSTIDKNDKDASKSASNPETGKGGAVLDTSRPSTTFSISDYLVDQEDTKNDSVTTHSRRSTAGNRGFGAAAPHNKRVSSSLKQERPADNLASAELRFAALMTSKWLSFGRLLFSPAHEEANTGEHTRILIVDGLGKEWSYNCALTYPRCQFYNLGPEPLTPSWETLSNHHHITHPSISTPFPFPNNYFTAVVFRFAIAAADTAYQSCFHELKRVLRPSGYLEMSVLDLDLMNMGHIARTTIRDLKIRIHQHDSQISLWNHGDAFLTLLGKRGFENLQRCVVGIPVAGRIRRSQDSGSSSSSGTNNLLNRERKRQEESQPEYLRFTEWMQGKNDSDDNNDNEEDEMHKRRNDEDITKTVAKIGRWWYSSCYPDPGEGEGGIWETEGLLRECERQRTSFRLLFCYAQKPVCVKRRTASV